MQDVEFMCLGRPIRLWTHPDPDHLGRVIRQTRGFYELDVLAKCRERHVPGTMIVDVGANIGNHAVFFGAVLGARVHAFEPAPMNLALLGMNVAANGLDDRVVVHGYALGARDAVGAVVMNEPDNAGAVSVALGAGEVAVRTLDGVGIEGPVSLVKIDVEGAEVAVLVGAEALLQIWMPDVMLEAADDDAFAAAAGHLARRGYALQGRYAWTPTYLFTAERQAERLGRLAGAIS